MTDVGSRDDIHDILEREMEFPVYYGRNLDALFDCLTDIDEDTAVGVYLSDGDSLVSEYLRRLQTVFADAEDENSHLAVFFFTYSDSITERINL